MTTVRSLEEVFPRNGRAPMGLREALGDLDYDSSISKLIDVVEFDGPQVSTIAGNKYVTLTQYGVRAEGASAYPDEDKRCWTEAEAWWRFKRALWTHLLNEIQSGANIKQFAWRERPFAQQAPDGDFIVRCRFAVIGEA